MKQKQIKEIASIIHNARSGRLPLLEDLSTTEFITATALYESGYRKQSDTIKEFVGKLKSIYSGREKRELHTRISFLFDRIDEIAKEYGAEGEE